ncbi:hypothetical protein LINPERHAP1_LOCUS37698, partial [Linum perenne]
MLGICNATVLGLLILNDLRSNSTPLHKAILYGFVYTVLGLLLPCFVLSQIARYCIQERNLLALLRHN